MTRERINDFKEIVLPSISKFLLDIDYEGQGKCDAEEFAKDFNEILDLAAKALEQEPCDDTVSRGVLEQVMWERDTAIEQLHKLGYDLGQKIEPCDDCVSRQAVIDIAKSSKSNWIDNSVLFKRVNELPPVLPKRKQGEWCEQNDDYFDWYECSECGYGSEGEMQYSSEHDVRTKYCPNCGTEMR